MLNASSGSSCSIGQRSRALPCEIATKGSALDAGATQSVSSPASRVASGVPFVPSEIRWALPKGVIPEGIPWSSRRRIEGSRLRHDGDARYKRMEVRYNARQPVLMAALTARRERMRAAGWNDGSAWQHDHIRPLVEANGDIAFWELDNIATLCTPCHKEKTAAESR